MGIVFVVVHHFYVKLCLHSPISMHVGCGLGTVECILSVEVHRGGRTGTALFCIAQYCSVL